VITFHNFGTGLTVTLSYEACGDSKKIYPGGGGMWRFKEDLPWGRLLQRLRNGAVTKVDIKKSTITSQKIKSYHQRFDTLVITI
jgi:hypothetical protein